MILSPWQKRWLYGVTALSWLSGAAWLYLQYFRQIQGDLGRQMNPAQPLCMEIHGAAAMGFLMVFGALLLRHVPQGWREKRQRFSGVLLTAFCGLLIVTGWGLYYLVNQSVRNAIGILHWGLGLALPVVLFLHVLASRKK